MLFSECLGNPDSFGFAVCSGYHNFLEFAVCYLLFAVAAIRSKEGERKGGVRNIRLLMFQFPGKRIHSAGELLNIGLPRISII